MIDTLIIGSGYLGSIIKEQLTGVVSSSLDNSGDFHFKLEEGDFRTLPKAKNLIITCSTENMNNRIFEFSKFVKENYDRVILISTASLFNIPYPDAQINEQCPLKDHPRTQSESVFEDFAIILHLGLLWDPVIRKPEKWLSRIKNGKKYVNLCNSKLVADVCKTLLIVKEKHTGHFICTDGKATRWVELANRAKLQLPELKTGKESKILSCKKLQITLKSKIDWNSYVYF